MEYILVSEYEDSEFIEIPLEEDGTVLLTTVNGIFPKISGLKYRSSESGAFRALRLSDGKFYKPIEGWHSFRFVCVFPKDNNKRKNVEESEKPFFKSKRLEGRKCTDLIVLNLGWNVNEEILKTYFSKYGELVLVQVKRDRDSNQSKGFAFIRYTDYESQVLCLADKHLIDSRWCPVKVPFSKNEADKQEISKKIHITYPSEDITVEDIRNTFEKYGYVSHIFIPKPFRNFAFVTFDDAESIQSLIGQTLVVKGHNITVGSAVPKVNNNKKIASPSYGMQDDMTMQSRFGMPNPYASYMTGGYEPQKNRGLGHNTNYHNYSGLLPNPAMQMMMSNGNKSGQEAIQQGYANQDMMQHAFYGQYQQYDNSQQGMAASTAMNILNNPDVVAAIVAAANKNAKSSAQNKYSQ